MAEDAPRFDGVRFAVLALGDSSYVNFCEVGRRIDARLEALGGERIAPRVDCDLDYEAPAAAWSGGALEELARRAEPDAGDGRPRRRHHPRRLRARRRPASLYSKANPFPAEITESINLNSSRSTKQTIHLEAVARGLRARLRARRLARHRAGERPGDGRGGAARGGSRRRRCPRAPSSTSEFDITALSRQVIEAYAAINPDAEAARAARGRRLARLRRGPADRRSARGFPGEAGAGAAHRPAAQAAAAPLLGRLGARGAARTRRISWSASCATRATAARAAASPRASSPSGCGSATGSRSTSSRTRTSACRTIRTGRSS